MPLPKVALMPKNEPYKMEKEVRRALYAQHQKGHGPDTIRAVLIKDNPYGTSRNQKPLWEQLVAKQVALYAKQPQTWVKFCGLPEAQKDNGQ